jgi:hypothetical protein
MESIPKLLLFIAFLWLLSFTGFHVYKFSNKKITGSETAWGILFWALFLILCNAVLFFGGLWLLIKTYGLISADE